MADVYPPGKFIHISPRVTLSEAYRAKQYSSRDLYRDDTDGMIHIVGHQDWTGQDWARYMAAFDTEIQTMLRSGGCFTLWLYDAPPGLEKETQRWLGK